MTDYKYRIYAGGAVVPEEDFSEWETLNLTMMTTERFLYLKNYWSIFIMKPKKYKTIEELEGWCSVIRIVLWTLVIPAVVTLVILATSYSAQAAVKMTVTFHDGKQVIRQFVDYDEMLMEFQNRESCAIGVVDIHIEQVHIEGMDDD